MSALNPNQISGEDSQHGVLFTSSAARLFHTHSSTCLTIPGFLLSAAANSTEPSNHVGLILSAFNGNGRRDGMGWNHAPCIKKICQALSRTLLMATRWAAARRAKRYANARAVVRESGCTAPVSAGLLRPPEPLSTRSSKPRALPGAQLAAVCPHLAHRSQSSPSPERTGMVKIISHGRHGWPFSNCRKHGRQVRLPTERLVNGHAYRRRARTGSDF